MKTAVTTEQPTRSSSADNGNANGNQTLVRRTFCVVTDPQNYRNIAYLLLGLPIGVVSFSLLVTAVSIGLATIVVALLGIPILVGCWYLARSIANVERAAACSASALPPPQSMLLTSIPGYVGGR